MPARRSWQVVAGAGAATQASLCTSQRLPQPMTRVASTSRSARRPSSRRRPTVTPAPLKRIRRQRTTVSEVADTGMLDDYTVTALCTKNGQPDASSSGPSVDVTAAGTDQIDCTFHNSLKSPGNLTPPSVPGTPVVGTPITADHGSWSRHPDSYHYAWQRCDAAGTSCADIPGAADDPHYTPVACRRGRRRP